MQKNLYFYTLLSEKITQRAQILHDRRSQRSWQIHKKCQKVTYCYSRVSRQDWDFRKLFLIVEREKNEAGWILVQSADSVVTSSSQWAFEKDQGMSTWRICLAWRKWLVKADVT